MSKIFRPLIIIKKGNHIFRQCFYAITNKDEMFTVLENYHQLLLQENMKAAPDKSHFFLTRVKFLGHITERNTTTPLKSRIDEIKKLQPPSNKKKNTRNFWNVKLLK